MHSCGPRKNRQRGRRTVLGEARAVCEVGQEYDLLTAYPPVCVDGFTKGAHVNPRNRLPCATRPNSADPTVKLGWILGGLAAALAVTAVAAAVSAARKPRNRHVPEPAKAVDLQRYLGRWYELGRYENRFERDCDVVTADYSLGRDGKVEIVNACRLDGGDGTFKKVKGRAKVVPRSNGAKLKVSFFGPFYVGDYWVLDHAEDYSWSIVGEPRGTYLWLLSRRSNPGDDVRRAIYARAAELGYDTERIRTTWQGHATASA